MSKERKTDGQGRRARGQLEERAPRGSSSVHTWGKVAGGSLLSVPSSLAASSPLRCLEHGFFFLFFFFSPVLAVLACISMPSCQNSLKETAAGELRNVSQTPGLVWGLEDSYRKLKRFLGQCLLWVFPLLPLTFSIFNFFFFFHFYLRHWLLQWPASVFLMVPFRVRLWPFSQPSLTSWVIF